MAPKKTETRQTSEMESTEMGPGTITDPNNARLTMMEQIMISLQQQMQQQIQLQSNQQNTLDSLEQKLSEEDDRKKRTLEIGKSKVMGGKGVTHL
ncbi:hypothetical protein F2Q69_00013845 [Brassica cretica]|uniref:Uncharacterized protein n=1 Tax=Brassica cretica TaxID=69181 RepID=A0A8S9QX67_BRACR|nr:hypothetical protein F2Q69_00013845 [Brassica cretica]